MTAVLKRPAPVKCSIGTTHAVELITRLVRSDKLRDALLVALCLGGMPVGQVISLRLDELRGVEDACASASDVRTAFNRIQQILGGSNVNPHELISYYVWQRSREVARCWKYSQQEHLAPAFGSRKGYGPPDLRTAERWVKAASEDCHLPYRTLRWIRKCGLKVVVSVPDLRKSSIGAVAARAEWFLHRSFTRMHDFEDAVQEVRLRLLITENRRKCPLLVRGCERLALQVARAVRNEAMKRRAESVNVLLGNVAWLEQNETADSAAEGPLVGLNQVDARLFRRLQRRILTFFRGRRREIVQLLYGVGEHRWPLSCWEVSKRLRLSVTEVWRVEQEAVKVAAQLGTAARRLVLPTQYFISRKRLSLAQEMGERHFV